MDFNVDYHADGVMDTVERYKLYVRITPTTDGMWKVSLMHPDIISAETIEQDLEFAMRQALQKLVLKMGYMPEKITPKEVQHATRNVHATTGHNGSAQVQGHADHGDRRWWDRRRNRDRTG